MLYMISAHEFYHKMKKDDTCWKNLNLLVSDNDKYTFEKLKNFHTSLEK